MNGTFVLLFVFVCWEAESILAFKISGDSICTVNGKKVKAPFQLYIEKKHRSQKLSCDRPCCGGHGEGCDGNCRGTILMPIRLTGINQPSQGFSNVLASYSSIPFTPSSPFNSIHLSLLPSTPMSQTESEPYSLPPIMITPSQNLQTIPERPISSYVQQFSLNSQNIPPPVAYVEMIQESRPPQNLYITPSSPQPQNIPAAHQAFYTLSSTLPPTRPSCPMMYSHHQLRPIELSGIIHSLPSASMSPLTRFFQLSPLSEQVELFPVPCKYGTSQCNCGCSGSNCGYSGSSNRPYKVRINAKKC